MWKVVEDRRREKKKEEERREVPARLGTVPHRVRVCRTLTPEPPAGAGSYSNRIRLARSEMSLASPRPNASPHAHAARQIVYSNNSQGALGRRVMRTSYGLRKHEDATRQTARSTNMTPCHSDALGQPSAGRAHTPIRVVKTHKLRPFREPPPHEEVDILGLALLTR